MTTRIKTTPKTQLYNMEIRKYESINKDSERNWQRLVDLMDVKFGIILEKGKYTNFNTIDFIEIIKIIETIDFDLYNYDIGEFLNSIIPNTYDENLKKMRLEFQHFNSKIDNTTIYDFQLFKIIVTSLDNEITALADYVVNIDDILVKIIFTGIQMFIDFKNIDSKNYQIASTSDIYKYRNTYKKCLIYSSQKVKWCYSPFDTIGLTLHGINI